MGWRKWSGRTVVLSVLCALCSADAPAAVTVEKAPVVVVRKTFDRRNPPKDMPALGPDADAITNINFTCSANARYATVLRAREGPAGSGSSTRINDIAVKVGLEITIWVPRGARRKLVDHEGGHRVIGERVYETAERVAREEARRWVGRRVTGADDDAAVREATQRCCDAYLDATSNRAGRIGRLYDEITRHGRADTEVEAAIEEAFRRDAREHPAATPTPVPERASERARGAP